MAAYHLAALTIARMPALTAAGRVGQASIRWRRSGSLAVETAAGAPDCAPPDSETGIFPEESCGRSSPVSPTLAVRSGASRACDVEADAASARDAAKH